MKDLQVEGNYRPFWLGALIAPLACPLVMFVCMTSWLAITEGTHGLKDWRVGLVAVAVFVMPQSYAGMWLLGMPYLLWLRRVGRLSTLNIGLGSAATGSATSVCFFSFVSKPELFGALLLMVWIGVGAVFGLLAGMVFCWVIGLWRRDRGV